MAITKRLVKGSAITAAEHDTNIDEFLARANHTGTQAISTVTGLQTALDAKVVGPASAVNNSLVAFDTTTGKLVKDTGVDAGDLLLVSSGATVTLSDTNGTTLITTRNSLTSNDVVYVDANGSLASGPTRSNVEAVAIEFIIDGGGSAITTGVKGYLKIPVGMTITSVDALADQSGSIVVDIWKDTYANYPPTDIDSITASAPVTISSAVKSTDSTLTGWTTSVAAGDILGFNVDSASTVELVTIVINGTLT